MLANMFQMGWFNHQLHILSPYFGRCLGEKNGKNKGQRHRFGRGERWGWSQSITERHDLSLPGGGKTDPPQGTRVNDGETSRGSKHLVISRYQWVEKRQVDEGLIWDPRWKCVDLQMKRRKSLVFFDIQNQVKTAFTVQFLSTNAWRLQN